MRLFYFIPACQGERCSPDGGCRANLLPAGYQQTDIRDAEDLQQRKACHLQHVPMLPQGQNLRLAKKTEDVESKV